MNMRKFSMRTTRFTLNKNRKFQFYLISLWHFKMLHDFNLFF
jgi:hypothetical protein